MEIIIAKTAGFCYGVKRAIKIAEETLGKAKGKCFTLGPIIHNPAVVSDLEQKGLHVADDVKGVREGTVIIRSHGISRNESDHLKKNSSVKLVDTTCPFVTKARRLLEILKRKGYTIFYLGDKKHPEVMGLLSYIDNDAFVFLNPDEIPDKDYKKVGLISQTTQKAELLKEAASKLLGRCEELRIYNTICKTTSVRQRETKELAQKVDMMIVLGGKMSSNTKKLAEISKTVQSKTHHVETVQELKKQWFKGVRKVGITAGASTPKEHIADVIQYIKNLKMGE